MLCDSFWREDVIEVVEREHRPSAVGQGARIIVVRRVVRYPGFALHKTIMADRYDTIIRDVSLCDGLGNPCVAGSLAIRDGRIAAIGDVRGSASTTIDGRGLTLAPGIIDNHTHYDAQLTWDPWVDPSPAHGITTAVIGNCGFTIAPCKPADRELVMRNLTHVEGMSLDALQAGIRWDFETFPEYLATLERHGVGVNVAAFVGHSSVRTFVMGADAPRRAARPDEVARMRELVVDAMRAGAVGFSTTTSPAHNGEGGIPMPSRLADDTEMQTLVGALADVGRGVFMLTKGGHTKLAFLEDLARRSARPVVIAALLHNGVNPRPVFDDFEAIAAANTRGHRLLGAVSACPLTMEVTMASPYPFEGLVAWKPAKEAADGATYRAVLGQRAFRDALRAELSQPAVFRLFNGEWDRIHVTEVADAANARFEGRTIAAIAREAGVDPMDCMFDLALSEDLRTLFTATLLNTDETAVAQLITHPHSIISLSDAGAHLTFFNDVGFGLHVLGHWVRDRQAMTLEEGVRRLTSQQADVYGLRERGSLEVGHHADLMLFDPRTVGRGPKQRKRDLPAGAPRLVTTAEGLAGVWVNGVRIVDAGGRIAGAPMAGRVLREFAG